MMNTQKSIDFLNLSDKIGRTKSFVIYSLMIFALFNLIAALVLILVPINDPNFSKNNQMIIARRQWAKEQDLQKQITESKILLKVEAEQISKQTTSEKNFNKKLASLNMFSSVVPVQSSDYYGSSQISHQWNYSSKLSEEISFSFYLNEISNKSQIGFANQGDEEVSVELIKQTQFNLQDMISLGMCHDMATCTTACIQNNNDFIKTEKNEAHCTGSFQVTSICAVMDFNQNQVLRGCYKNGEFEKYSFVPYTQETKKTINHQNAKSIEPVDISFEIYDKLDPYVKALEISQTYEAFEQSVSPYQKIAKYFFLMGGCIAVIVLFVLACVNASQKQEDKSDESNVELPAHQTIFDPTSYAYDEQPSSMNLNR